MAELKDDGGFKEVYEALDNLDVKMAASLYRSANRKAIRNTLTVPYQNASISNRAKSNIKIQSNKNDKTAVMIGPHTDAYPERWLQKGTAERYTKTGAYRGSIKAREQYEEELGNEHISILKYIKKEMAKDVEKLLRSKLKSTRTKKTKLGL